MAAFVGDFDDSFDEQSSSPPLPPEDRIWRHPSEVGSDATWFAQDSVAVRRRWIERETSRGSAWTAGIVGAILATGLVALGTHLATAFTTPPIDGGPATTSAPVPTNQLAAATGPAITALSATMSARIRSVGQSVALIEVGRAKQDIRCLAVVIRPNGVLMAPAAAISGATSLLVTLANGVQYVGVPEGTDTTTGVAIVRINGAKSLSTIDFGRPVVDAGEMALAVTSAGGRTYALGTVAATNVQSGGLVDTLATDVPSSAAPLGSALLDPRGNVIGIVTGTDTSGVVATPSWLAAPVSSELITSSHVVHGWLGMISGSTYATTGSSSPAGVLITSIAKNSAAAQAGIIPGDVITSLNGQSIQTLSTLRARLYVLAPGTTVHLGLVRSNKHLELNVLLDARVPA